MYYTLAPIEKQAGFIQVPLAILKAHGRAALAAAAVTAGKGRRWTTEQAASNVGCGLRQLKLYRKELIDAGWLHRIRGTRTGQPSLYVEGSRKWIDEPYIPLYRSVFELSWSEQILLGYVIYRSRNLKKYGFGESTKTIADSLGLDRATVKRARRSLVTRGLLVNRGRVAQNGTAVASNDTTVASNGTTYIERLAREHSSRPVERSVYHEGPSDLLPGLASQPTTTSQPTVPSQSATTSQSTVPARSMASGYDPSSYDQPPNEPGHICCDELKRPGMLYQRLAAIRSMYKGRKHSVELPSSESFWGLCQWALTIGREPEKLVAGKLRDRYWHNDPCGFVDYRTRHPEPACEAQYDCEGNPLNAAAVRQDEIEAQAHPRIPDAVFDPLENPEHLRHEVVEAVDPATQEPCGEPVASICGLPPAVSDALNRFAERKAKSTG